MNFVYFGNGSEYFRKLRKPVLFDSQENKESVHFHIPAVLCLCKVFFVWSVATLDLFDSSSMVLIASRKGLDGVNQGRCPPEKMEPRARVIVWFEVRVESAQLVLK